MPEKKTMQRAKQAKREGKAPSTQAGAFVHEEIEHVREGKHGARNAKQAIAIGLSKARRAGVKVRAPKKGATSAATRTKAKRDLAKGSGAKKKTTAPSATRSRAAKGALKREGHGATTSRALSRQARAAAAGRRRKRSTSTRGTKARARAEAA
jgi:hypothetical protein